MRKTILLLFTVCLICNNAFALSWNDPGVVPVQSISDHRWRDANTGRLISVQGMPGISNTTTTTVPQTPPVTTTTVPQTNQTNTTTTPQTNPTNTARVATKTLQRTVAAAGAAVGAYGIYENTKGRHEHTTGNVTAGAVSGLLGGATIGALRGAKGGWIGAAIGAAAGAAVTGSQLFSETDCLTDPVTGDFTCCNTVFNKGERQAKIGDYMFCGVMQGDQLTEMPPLVRQCLQGGQPTELSWWDGLWQDDTWTPGECIPRYCDSEPPVGIMVKYIPDTERFCWNWEYVDNDELGTIRTSDGQILDPNDPYSVLIYRLTQEANKLKQQCGNTF